MAGISRTSKIKSMSREMSSLLSPSYLLLHRATSVRATRPRLIVRDRIRALVLVQNSNRRIRLAGGRAKDLPETRLLAGRARSSTGHLGTAEFKRTVREHALLLRLGTPGSSRVR
jgi:hypothetical protein